MKVLKKHEFKPRVPYRPAAKYPWREFLDGRILQLTAGEDYPATGTKKNGESYDFTDNFVMSLKAQADKRNRVVSVDKVEGGLIIQAIPMTAEQIAARDKRRAEAEAKAAAKKAAAPAEGSFEA